MHAAAPLPSAAAVELWETCQSPAPDAARRLRALLATGAVQPNAQRNDGNTALHLAAQAGHAELVATLLHAGARADALNIKTQTPVHAAVASKRSSVLLQLLRYFSPHGTVEGCTLDLDRADAAGCTPLHVAAATGHAESVVSLLRAGASTTVADHHGARLLQSGHMCAALIMRAPRARTRAPPATTYPLRPC